ncbi:preprotein translocase subunit SecG [Chlorobium phaeovibrioides]|uniref:Protein-export membrane protein SecG n=2 Tax=Chlorobium phaeovibrioides TaxID=1094 RepID=A0A432ASZ5_CHLPH|nr:preprotein translocase subunit SecG [Chlorobium phaeovibrioides]HCD37063.1 preprotein translocase subunit SecG [Chlorobium sp.]KAA6232769.1 preprotein translocase subunit SecG [Chlorobium phaeovibrioides]MWV54894.1 preprotein translocase subunit SecG [Chlorobium phaeovibrioides]QEQ56817.1 preprotein translocase subunit SecG [Chlorobium phaeovibrioides]RTY36323.1 preprotein translocase subunit SecG [Chlorobium phaeovibrioides]
MHVFIVVLGLIASLLLIGVIMLQSPKSGSGLTGGIASLGTVQTMGVRRTGDFLGRVTAILAGVVMLLCFIAVFTLPERAGVKTGQKSILQETPVTAPPAVPSAPALPATPLK